MSKLPPSMALNNHSFPTHSPERNGTSPVFQTSHQSEWQPAPLFKRFIAALIDGIVSTVFAGLFKVFFIAIFFHNHPIIGYVLSVFSIAAYWMMIPVEFGATPGKKAMGLRIVGNDGDLKLGYGTMFLREYIGRFISAITVVGIFLVFFNKDKRALHDLIAKTKVIQYR